MGFANEHFFKVGQSFDAVLIDAKAPLIATSSLKNLCNTIVYSSDSSHLLGTIVAGNWVVKNGQHFDYENIRKGFVKSINEIKIR